MGHKVLGLEITDKVIKIALVKNGRRPVLLYCGTVAAPPTIGGDFSEDDSEISSVVLAVKELTSRERVLSKGVDSVALCASNPQTVVRRIQLPLLPAKEIDRAVEFELSQSFPGVANTHVISFKEYSRDKKNINGIVSFSPRKTIDTYRKLLDALDYKYNYIDVLPNSTAKAFLYFAEDGKNGGAALLCDIGYSSTQFTFVRGKNILHSRQIPDGDRRLKDVLTQSMGISVEEIERLQRSGTGKTSLNAINLNSAFNTAYSNILEQLLQTIEFYNNSDTEEKLPISCVYLAGGGVYPKLDEFFSSNVGLPVKVIRPHSRIVTDPFAFARVFSAIGAAIRED